ncbi:MAG: hypothetical protein ACXW07_10305 [Nitrososphaeraceae archaeon]
MSPVFQNKPNNIDSRHNRSNRYLQGEGERGLINYEFYSYEEFL